jgi:PAS domain S-box-containing protein
MCSYPIPEVPLEADNLADLLDQLPGLVYRCSLESEAGTHGRFVYASDGAPGLTGRTAADLEGLPLADLVFSGDIEQVATAVARATQEEGTYACTYRIIMPDDRLRWVRDTGRVVADERGVWLIGFLADATAQVRRQQYLERQAVRRTRRLAALYDVMELAGSMSNPRQAMQQALARVMAVIRAESGMVHLLSPSEGSLHLVAQQGLPPATEPQLVRLDSRSAPFSLVLADMEPVRFPVSNLDLPPDSLLADEPAAEYVGVPIRTEEASRGILSVLITSSGRLSLEEQDLLVSVGEQMGVWLEYTRLRRQADELLVLQERNRLARELHDSVTQSLYSVTLLAEAGRRMALAGEVVEAAHTLQRVSETGRQALKEMRLLVHKLRPSILTQEGLVRALQNRLNAVEGRAGVQHELAVAPLPELSPDVEEALYHIAQEALNNALKHGGGNRVQISLQIEEGLIKLVVDDNGCGFDQQAMVAAADGGHGFGLTSMRERAEMLGGWVNIQTAIGQGTEVTAWLPAGAHMVPADPADLL